MKKLIRLIKVLRERTLIKRKINNAIIKGKNCVTFYDSKFYYENLGWILDKDYKITNTLKDSGEVKDITVSW